MPLKEQDRKKLDSIVQQMVQNGESDQNIQLVVNDFKNKYGDYEKSQTSIPAQKPKQEKKYFGKDANAVVGANVLPSIGRFLGMEQFGQGLSLLLPESVTGVDKAREAQQAEQEAINSLPPETLRRMAREGKTVQPSGALKDLTSASTHDLTNRQVIGSAVATGANIIGGAGAGSARGLLGRSLIGGGAGAVTGGALSAAEGDSYEDIAKNAAIGGTIGAAIPGIGAGAKKSLRGLGKVLGEATELLGTSEEAVRTAYNPGSRAGKKAFDAARKGKVSGLDILKKAETAMSDFANKTRTEYRAALNSIPGVKNRRITKKDVVSSVANSLDEHGVKITKEGLDFSGSTISDATEVARIQQMYDDLLRWKDNTVFGMDTLKKRMTDTVDKLQGGKGAFVLSQKIRNAVGDKLKAESPEYAQMVGRYDEMIDLANDLRSTLSLGRKGKKGINPKTAYNKVLRVLARNNDFEQAVLQQLDEKTGAQLKQSIAGASFNPIVAQGLTRQIQTGSGLGVLGGMLAGVPGLQGAALAGLIGLSPRVQGIAVRNAGRLLRPAGAAAGVAGRLSPATTGVLGGLLANPGRQNQGQ